MIASAAKMRISHRGRRIQMKAWGFLIGATVSLHAVITAAAFLHTGPLFGQSDSRTADIAAQQQQKAAQVTPVTQNRIERTMLRLSERGFFQRLLNGGNGFYPKFGGMAPEAGIGLGVGYNWTGKQLTLRSGAVISTRSSRKFDVELSAPKLSNSRFF